jgi:hypothetical protein
MSELTLEIRSYIRFYVLHGKNPPPMKMGDQKPWGESFFGRGGGGEGQDNEEQGLFRQLLALEIKTQGPLSSTTSTCKGIPTFP